MEINLSKNIKQFITALFLLILPLITIVLGLTFNVLNAWYYISCVTWFCAGVIFFSAIYEL